MSRRGGPQEPATEQSKPTMDEYRALLKQLVGDERALLMVRLSAETSMTRMEIAKLEKKYFKKDRREIYISHAKGIVKNKKGDTEERNRWVPLTHTLVPLLELHMLSHDSPYVFTQEHKFKVPRPLSDSAINFIFREAKIPWSPHKFRHFFRTQVKRWMIKNRRFDIEILDEFMGHNQTQGAHYSDNALEDKLEIVDEVFG